MKIVNLEEFLDLPSGTLFSRYEPIVLGALEIKRETCPMARDFYYTNLVDVENWEDSFLDLDSGKIDDVLLDNEGSSRDGLFEEDALFVIYTKKDIWAIVRALDTALELAPGKNEDNYPS